MTNGPVFIKRNDVLVSIEMETLVYYDDVMTTGTCFPSVNSIPQRPIMRSF